MQKAFRLRRAAVAVVCAAAAAISCNPSTGPSSADEFELDIEWIGTQPTGGALDAFNSAFNRARSLIAAPLVTAQVQDSFNLQDDCGVTGADVMVPKGLYRGLRVYVRVTPIDGAGGTLAVAGPCLVRGPAGSQLPLVGVLSVDQADVAPRLAVGQLDDVVLHELLHVMGLGTLWPMKGLLTDTISTDSRYVGAQARTACATAAGGTTFCATNVPVHSDTAAGSEGSSYSHWRESVFQTELMTPFMAGGGGQPLSEMSIKSLADLGYTVDASSADPFTISGTAVLARSAEPAEPALRWAEPMRPRLTVDATGHLVRIGRQ